MRTLTHMIFALTFACGAGETGGGDGDVSCDNTGRLLPLAEGNLWAYKITDRAAGVVETKTQQVGPLEELTGDKAGISAFRMTTTKNGGTVISWQEDTGDAILRHRELDMAGGTQTDEIYDPYKLRVDEIAEHVVAGANWREDYAEVVTDTATLQITTTNKTESWTVEATDDIVTVPAGSFCAVRIHRISTANTGGSDKMYWFAPGVGKIREDAGDRLEELDSYDVR